MSLEELEEVTLVHMTLAGGRGQGKRGLLAWSLAAAQSHQEPRTMAGITELALLELRGLEFCKPPPHRISWSMAAGHPWGDSGTLALLALG